MSDEPPPDERDSSKPVENLGSDDVSAVETRLLLELWDKNICPFCGKSIPEGRRVGSGRKREGGVLQPRVLRQLPPAEAGLESRETPSISRSAS